MPPPPQWLRLLSVLRRWFCCCWSVVWCASHWLWGLCVCLCFVLHYFVSSLVLQPSWTGRESWLLCFHCLTHVFFTVNVLWLFLTVPWVGLRCVIMVFPDHTHFLTCFYDWCISLGAQWLSGRVLDLRPRGRRFEPHRRHCVVSMSKNINPSLVLVQPRKIRPFITERLLIGRKESNQLNKQNWCTPSKVIDMPKVRFYGRRRVMIPMSRPCFSDHGRIQKALSEGVQLWQRVFSW